MKGMTQENGAADQPPATMPDPPYMGPWLDLAEAWARGKIGAAYETAKLIEAQTNVTLTVLLTGGGAALGFATQLVGKAPGLWQAALAASLWLFAVAGWCVARVLRLTDYPGQYQNPRDVLPAKAAGCTPEQARGYVVDNLQREIDAARAVNEMRAARLNRVRAAACLTPLIAVAAYWVCRLG